MSSPSLALEKGAHRISSPVVAELIGRIAGRPEEGTGIRALRELDINQVIAEYREQINTINFSILIAALEAICTDDDIVQPLVRHFADNDVLKIEWDIDSFAPALNHVAWNLACTIPIIFEGAAPEIQRKALKVAATFECLAAYLTGISRTAEGE